MHEATPLVTAEELERMPDFRGELVEGRLVEMSPVNLDHGTVVVRLAALLHLISGFRGTLEQIFDEIRPRL
jgi:Uma2 family endonuclease